MTNYNHPFHLVTLRPWPLLISLSLLNLIINLCQWLFYNNPLFFIISILSSIIILCQWWRDVVRERTFQGYHTKYVYNRIRLGIIIFIISELIFFIAFFWSFFHSSLSPSIDIGRIWPPKGINVFNPYDIPLINTIILISSGITITWSHHSILKNKLNERIKRLYLTIILGILFSFLQLLEYIEAPFCINDRIYGSTFFLITGFHGIHVIIGTSFILICLIRLINLHFSKNHHFRFEAASWYWHFVDIVWLFLYISIYWWNFYIYSIKNTFNFQLKN